MIIKLSRSLKQFQVVGDPVPNPDSPGELCCFVYGCSVGSLKSLVERGDSGKFVVLTRLPVPVSSERFPSSPVYRGPTLIDVSSLDKKRDSFSVPKSKVKERVPVGDVVVDWGE
jgi:hypothetical protein